jgi:Ca-activated chloride channel family protein
LGIAWWGAGWRRRVAGACVWLAVAGVVLTASQPSIGDRTAGRKEILELVVDVSGSTQATDVAPTRLSAIQRSLLRLLAQLPPRVQVGVVSFSGSATSLARPTSDRDAVRGKIPSLSTDGPTAIGDALKLALADVQAARPVLPATVLLVSDGANTQGSNPAEAVRKAQALRVPILAVAVGTPDGTVAIPTDVTAVLLAHEQEHCVRAPDDRETPAVDEEVRLARKLGKARLIEYVTASYSNLDKTGHWKR